MLDYRIETFLAVCRRMNFTKAAGGPAHYPSGGIYYIRYLEEEYQAKLLEYQGKKIRLTVGDFQNLVEVNNLYVIKSLTTRFRLSYSLQSHPGPVVLFIYIS